MKTVDWSAVSIPNPNVLSPTGELPCRDPYPGKHMFDVKVDFTGNHQNYVVSPKPLQILFTYFVSMV